VTTQAPLLVPLGDSALLVRFSDRLDEEANRAAISFAARLRDMPPEGVEEAVPNLVSVLLRFDPRATDTARLAGELRLLLVNRPIATAPANRHSIDITFDGEDLEEVARLTGLDRDAFVGAHNKAPLRVLATGFAPGFVYCGFHPEPLHVPRRTVVRAGVPAGTVIFAAGQTAVAATPVPTGWHVIGHTGFRNFDPATEPPTKLRAGDTIAFRAVPT
jgi:KipI family sensor histidine kinase inhibitor